MSGSGRIPLWVVATIAGLGVITVVGIFFYVNLFMVMDKSVDNMLLLSLRDEL